MKKLNDNNRMNYELEVDKSLETISVSIKVIGFLSGAPRVSTRPEAEATGPRSHVLGVINAFENKHWRVKRFIVGDRLPDNWSGSKSSKKVSKNAITRIAADLLRIALGYLNGRKAVKELGPVDCVYERFGAFQALGRQFQRNGIPWILETNAPLFIEATENRNSMFLSGIAKSLELKAYKQCDILVCVSDELKKIILSHVSLPQEKILVLPNGVDTNKFDPAYTAPIRYFNLPTIGFVGKLSSWQGLDMLVVALSDLAKEGFRFGLTIAGDGPHRENLERLVSETMIGQNVKFLGQLPWDTIPGTIAGFDLCYSGQQALESVNSMYLSPLKLYEYGSMGKPIVASAHRDSQELLSNGLGYLFESANIDSLENTLRVAFAEKISWQSKGEDLRKVVINNHSWSSRIDLLISKIDETLSTKSTNGGN